MVANNGNNVEVTFDFVERIVRLVAFDNVASTHRCWCGRGLNLDSDIMHTASSSLLLTITHRHSRISYGALLVHE